MNFYTPASTANPTGWRPWNSRLSFYAPASFALPTTGLAIPRRRYAEGGLQTSALSFYAPGTYPLPTTGTGLPAQRFANGGMGFDLFGVEVDPTLLGLAGVALLAGLYLYGPKRRRRRR